MARYSRTNAAESALADRAEIAVSDRDATILRFRPILADATEAAMIFGELYRCGGQWKFRAVGQGFDGGLAPPAESFGIDIAADLVDPPVPSTEAVPTGRILLEDVGRTIMLSPWADGFAISS